MPPNITSLSTIELYRNGGWFDESTTRDNPKQNNNNNNNSSRKDSCKDIKRNNSKNEK